jgi:glucan phosphoethanolaminetransferase (alkaline phosphatase superfamily)
MADDDSAPLGARKAAAPRSLLRALVLLGAAAETLFWFWTFSYIGARANPRGDGMEWLAEMPMTLIFLLLTLPALLLARRGRLLPVAAVLVLASAAANAFLWSEIVSEFAGTVVR